MRSVPMLRRRHRHGLTLIELVLVVAVLAILAGFIVPRLGFIRNLAGEAGNATIIADAVNQAVLYNTAEGHYPVGEDTLLNTTGTVDTHLNKSLQAILAAQTVSGLDASSLLGQFGANTTTGTAELFNQADVSTATPNQDDSSATTLNTTGIPLAVVSTTTTTGEEIYRVAYSSTELSIDTTGTLGTPNDGTYLVALGYGSNSAINGKTGLEPPVLFDKTPGEYTRPILLLKVFGAGSTATGVPAGSNATTSIGLGFDGTTVNGQLSKYAVDQNR